MGTREHRGYTLYLVRKSAILSAAHPTPPPFSYSFDMHANIIYSYYHTTPVSPVRHSSEVLWRDVDSRQEINQFRVYPFDEGYAPEPRMAHLANLPGALIRGGPILLSFLRPAM